MEAKDYHHYFDLIYNFVKEEEFLNDQKQKKKRENRVETHEHDDSIEF